MVLSIGVFFSLMIVGLSSTLPHEMSSQLEANGVSATQAEQLAHQPVVGNLFAAFLGYNPMETLLGSADKAGVTAQQWDHITGKQFFPELISDPFMHGLRIAFTASLVMCLIAAAASWLRGGKYVHEDDLALAGAGAGAGPGSGGGIDGDRVAVGVGAGNGNGNGNGANGANGGDDDRAGDDDRVGAFGAPVRAGASPAEGPEPEEWSP
jgi:hypothetical protein